MVNEKTMYCQIFQDLIQYSSLTKNKWLKLSLEFAWQWCNWVNTWARKLTRIDKSQYSDNNIFLMIDIDLRIKYKQDLSFHYHI